MSPPPKPWESTSFNTSLQTMGNMGNEQLQSSAYIGVQPMPFGQGMPAQGNIRQTRQLRNPLEPPPLPPRLHSTIPQMSFAPGASYSAYSGVGMAPFSGMGGLGGYGTLGSYGTMGSYGNMASYPRMGSYNSYGGYGMNPDNRHSRFIQMAEEGSRPAFQSIQSVVQAFSSVSYMLEATYGAVYSSFRAILGVAENFSHLTSLFGQVYSSFAALRLLKWMYNKLLYLAGLHSGDPSNEYVWQHAAEGGAANPAKTKWSWPVVMFMGIIFSCPYVVWRLFRQLNTGLDDNSMTNPETWRMSKNKGIPVMALHTFEAASEHEISFAAGQRLLLAPRDFQPSNMKGWARATLDGKTSGLVPLNYLGKTSNMRPGNARPTGKPQAQAASDQVSELLEEIPTNLQDIPEVPFAHQPEMVPNTWNEPPLGFVPAPDTQVPPNYIPQPSQVIPVPIPSNPVPTLVSAPAMVHMEPPSTLIKKLPPD